jgi:hydroxymethylglutaryl-CoA lyase
MNATAANTQVNQSNTDHIKLVEVGPRDGLQNEAQLIPTHIKVELVDRLSAASFGHIEAAAFVSPKWVPQMADGAQVLSQIKRQQNTTEGIIAKPSISALVPNEKGMLAALAADIDEAVIFSAASESFVKKNINCSISESIARFEPVAQLAKAHGVRLRASISCCLGCPYEGEVPIRSVLNVVRLFNELGVDEIDIADTIGVGTAAQVKALMQAVAQEFDIARIAGHFHDTYGQGLTNVYASLEAGVRIFHSAVAGLGGCPFAQGATGNIASEDLLYLLNGLGLYTGVHLPAVVETGQWIAKHLGEKPAPTTASRASNALARKYALNNNQ